MSKRQGTRLKNSTSEASLLEQVRLLTIENETLRTFIAEKGFTQALPANSTNGEDRAKEKRARHGSSSASSIKNKSPNDPITPHTPLLGGRGCSCKGNCSTRVCGCVKKNIPCAEFCKCGNTMCQNSEPDKENIGDPNHQHQLSKDGEESLRKLSTLKLTDSKESKKNPTPLNPVNKRLEKVIKPRSIFSPEVTENVFTFEDALGEVEFENLSLRFGDDTEAEGGSVEKDGKGSGAGEEAAKISKKKNNKKTDNTKAKNTGAAEKQDKRLDPIPSDAEADDQTESGPKKRTKKYVEKKGKATGAAGKQINRVEVNEMDEAVEDQEHSEPELTNKGKKKTENKGKANAATGKRNNGIDSDEEGSQENEHSEPEPSNKNKKKVGTKATGATRNRNNRIDSEVTEEEDPQDNEHSEPEPTNKNKKKAGKETTRAAGKRNNRMDSEQKHKLASQENENSESDSEPANKNKKKVEKKGKASALTKKRNNRLYSEDLDDVFEDSEHSESEPEPDNKNKKKVAKKAVVTGATGKRNNQVHLDEVNEEASQGTEHSESEPEPTNKNKRTAQTREKASKVQRDQQKERPVEMGESSSKNGDHVESDARKKTEKRGEKGVVAEAEEKKNHQKSSTEAEETSEVSDHSELSPTGSKTSSNPSVGTDNFLDPEAAEDFNPMKPRRQLSRSPMGPRTDFQPQRILDPSEILLPIPLKEETEEEVPPPAELAEAIVDWDEHLAKLVRCSKCGRTFHQHRIKKHETSCIKI